MNKFFKDLLDEGRIDPAPVFEYESDGVIRKVYQFTGDGAGMAQGRFMDMGDMMNAYQTFNADREDI